MLEGFKPMMLLTGNAFISVTKNGINFNKNVAIKMGMPDYVKFMLNSERKLFAIQTTNESDPYAIKFMRKGTSIEKYGVRYNNRDLENTLESLMNWDLSQFNYRIDGIYDEQNQAMIFDLNSARAFPVRKRIEK